MNGVMSVIGTFLPCQPRRAMSAIWGRPADICSNASFSHFGPKAVMAHTDAEMLATFLHLSRIRPAIRTAWIQNVPISVP